MRKIVYQQLTKSCNLKCVMCNFYENKFENLKTSHFKKMIDMYKTAGISHITFWGGEPFLFKGIYELIKYSKDEGFNVGIVTNGTILDKESILSVIKSLDKVFVSLDSGVEETHDTIRGKKGVFNSAFDFINYLNDIKHLNKDLEVNIDTTIQSLNYSDFDTVIEVALKYNSKINFDPVQLYGYGNNCDISLKPNTEQINIIKTKLLSLKERYPDIIIQGYDSLNIIFDYLNGVIINKKCESLNSDLLVDPLGFVYECWGNNKIIYNILEKGIQDITLKMGNKCDNCGFSHVREGAYYEGY